MDRILASTVLLIVRNSRLVYAITGIRGTALSKTSIGMIIQQGNHLQEEQQIKVKLLKPRKINLEPKVEVSYQTLLVNHRPGLNRIHQQKILLLVMVQQ